jgi:hypothetical protein
MPPDLSPPLADPRGTSVTPVVLEPFGAGSGVDPVSVDTSSLGREESTMPKSHPPYPPEFRRRMVELVRAGRTPEELSREFEPSAQSIATLPEQLRRSLTWDQGAEMAQHVQLRVDTGLAIYFCDPHSPWQRGTNENTNGLLRKYFPKGTDLSKHAPDDLAAIAAALNSRPRKTLGWKTPAEALDDRLRSLKDSPVATTP